MRTHCSTRPRPDHYSAEFFRGSEPVDELYLEDESLKQVTQNAREIAVASGLSAKIYAVYADESVGEHGAARVRTVDRSGDVRAPIQRRYGRKRLRGW